MFNKYNLERSVYTFIDRICLIKVNAHKLWKLCALRGICRECLFDFVLANFRLSILQVLSSDMYTVWREIDFRWKRLRPVDVTDHVEMFGRFRAVSHYLRLLLGAAMSIGQCRVFPWMRKSCVMSYPIYLM